MSCHPARMSHVPRLRSSPSCYRPHAASRPFCCLCNNPTSSLTNCVLESMDATGLAMPTLLPPVLSKLWHEYTSHCAPCVLHLEPMTPDRHVHPLASSIPNPPVLTQANHTQRAPDSRAYATSRDSWRRPARWYSTIDGPPLCRLSGDKRKNGATHRRQGRRTRIRRRTTTATRNTSVMSCLTLSHPHD